MHVTGPMQQRGKDASKVKNCTWVITCKLGKGKESG